MENITTELISLLRYLLPGFLAAWIFYAFTSTPKPSQFERVVQALIFTLFVQALVFCVEKISLWLGKFFALGSWGEHSELISSILCAGLLGFVFAYFTNSDKFHKFIRKRGITKETSYPSEWFGVFSNNVTYVVLHLEDERRVYGWPTEWPSEPGKGHFSLEQGSWLLENGDQSPMTGVNSILVRASDVRWVEFMEDKMEKDNGKKSTESTTSA